MTEPRDIHPVLSELMATINRKVSRLERNNRERGEEFANGLRLGSSVAQKAMVERLEKFLKYGI